MSKHTRQFIYADIVNILRLCGVWSPQTPPAQSDAMWTMCVFIKQIKQRKFNVKQKKKHLPKIPLWWFLRLNCTGWNNFRQKSVFVCESWFKCAGGHTTHIYLPKWKNKQHSHFTAGYKNYSSDQTALGARGAFYSDKRTTKEGKILLLWAEDWWRTHRCVLK